MKEVTYEDWQKNPTPRVMWVWDDNVEKEKVKRKVIYILSGVRGRKQNVITLYTDESCTYAYAHCAEIEKQRRMTNQELAWWLREKPTREWKYMNGVTVYGYYGYEEKCENEEVLNNILIREDDGKWREPLGVKSQLLRSKL